MTECLSENILANLNNLPLSSRKGVRERLQFRLADGIGQPVKLRGGQESVGVAVTMNFGFCRIFRAVA